mgnify:CR=1 FL=1
MGPLFACRSMYGANPFPEALKIAEYLRNHSSPAARIAVLGSEPEIYFYAARHSATGYIYMYPLMEPQPFAERMRDRNVRNRLDLVDLEDAQVGEPTVKAKQRIVICAEVFR